MIDVVSVYLLALLLFQPIEEIHNCNNPNLKGIVPHYVCDWDEDDFYTNLNGQKVLRPKRKKDNKIKAHYRKKYWNK
tara:strand:+ start:148 stop:378 length:231 start_codon:yes stop_codon:yes gene_type:complete